MSQSTVVAIAIAFAFLVFITVKGQLPSYISLII